MAELMEFKKKIPGPSDFKNMDPYKPKISGFYKNTQKKFSYMETHIEVKSDVPSSTTYESRGRSMTDILSKKAAQYGFKDKRSGDRLIAVKKTEKPGPGTYKVAESLDKTAVASLRKSYRHFFEREKKVSHMLTHLDSKKHIPGVGKYKTDDSYKKLSSPTTSMRRLRN